MSLIAIVLAGLLSADAPVPLPAPADTVAAAPLPDLSGVWILSLKDSTLPTPPAGRPTGDGPGDGAAMGGRRGGGMGGGGMGGRGGGRRGAGQGERRDNADRQPAGPPPALNRLEIFHAGDEFDVTNGQDVSHSLRIDGAEHAVWTRHGEARASAAWEGPVLVVTTRDQAGRNPRVRRYTLSPDGSRLEVSETAPGRKEGGGNLLLVYDRSR